MPKRKKIEVLAPIEQPSVPAAVGQALERLVEQKVAELLSHRDGALLEPWFRSRGEAQEVKRQQTIPEQRKWSVYYERYGCLHCHSDKRLHAGGGLCTQCRAKITRKLKAVVKGLAGGKVVR